MGPFRHADRDDRHAARGAIGAPELELRRCEKIIITECYVRIVRDDRRARLPHADERCRGDIESLEHASEMLAEDRMSCHAQDAHHDNIVALWADGFHCVTTLTHAAFAALAMLSLGFAIRPTPRVAQRSNCEGGALRSSLVMRCFRCNISRGGATLVDPIESLHGE